MKKNLVFDAAILEQVLSGNGTGIYYTALNLLTQFLACDQLNVTLFFPKKDRKKDICKLLQEILKRDFDVFPSINSFDNKISKYSPLEKKWRKERKMIRRFLLVVYLKVYKILSKKISSSEFKNRSFDIYFSPVFAVKKEVKANKKYVLLYDVTPLIFPEYFPDNISGWFSLLTNSFNSTDQYFSISTSTKNDFLKYYPILKSGQIKVTPLAASEKFRKVSLEEIERTKQKYGIPPDKKYIFSLCALEPRKNLIRAIKAFVDFVKKNNADDIVYVLGGGSWDSFLPKLKKRINDFPEELIHRIGHVADEDLASLHAGAYWFVYTSQYEGFELPPLEAMACGCPVITSNNSSLPEVVGDAGVTIDWDSDEQHVKAYENYYFNEKLRSETAAKGLLRAQQFSWKKTADLMIEEFLK